jgi:hypothetical protein
MTAIMILGKQNIRIMRRAATIEIKLAIPVVCFIINNNPTNFS